MTEERLVNAYSGNDDAAAEHALRPMTLGDFIGQHRVREQIDV